MRENQAEWRQSRLEVRDAAFMKVSEKVFPERAHVNSSIMQSPGHRAEAV